MKYLILPILFSLQLFAAVQSMPQDQQRMDPSVVGLATDNILEVFPANGRDVIEPAITTALNSMQISDIRHFVKLVKEALIHQQGNAITPSFINGLIIGINTGLQNVQQHEGIAVQAIAVDEGKSSHQMEDHTSASNPAELKAKRFQEFMAIATTEKNLDQTFESLKPYIGKEIAKLETFSLETFDEETWQTILTDIPANMATGGRSGPSRFNKALALIEQYIESAAHEN